MLQSFAPRTLSQTSRLTSLISQNQRAPQQPKAPKRPAKWSDSEEKSILNTGTIHKHQAPNSPAPHDPYTRNTQAVRYRYRPRNLTSEVMLNAVDLLNGSRASPDPSPSQNDWHHPSPYQSTQTATSHFIRQLAFRTMAQLLLVGTDLTASSSLEQALQLGACRT